MTTKTLDPTNAAPEQASKPTLELQRGACVEFVKFCKEQHLQARAAQTFLHMLHNQSWQKECETIRDAMRPEVDRVFEPVEKLLKEGVPCKDVFAELIHTLYKVEELKK